MSETEMEGQDMKKKNKPVDPGAVGIRLGEDLREQVEDLAGAEGKTIGGLCVELIERGMKNSPQRRGSLVLKSLAITKDQLTQFIRAAKNEERSWFSGPGEGVREAREVVTAIERLEHQLKEV